MLPPSLYLPRGLLSQRSRTVPSFVVSDGVLSVENASFSEGCSANTDARQVLERLVQIASLVCVLDILPYFRSLCCSTAWQRRQATVTTWDKQKEVELWTLLIFFYFIKKKKGVGWQLLFSARIVNGYYIRRNRSWIVRFQCLRDDADGCTFIYFALHCPFQTGESVQALQRSDNIENFIFGIEKNAK